MKELQRVPHARRDEDQRVPKTPRADAVSVDKRCAVGGNYAIFFYALLRWRETAAAAPSAPRWGLANQKTRRTRTDCTSALRCSTTKMSSGEGIAPRARIVRTRDSSPEQLLDRSANCNGNG